MAKPATPADALDHMQVRSFFTTLLATRGWKPRDFNAAMGWRPDNTRIYQWRAGKLPLATKARAEIERKLGASLDGGGSGDSGGGALVTTAQPPLPVGATRTTKPIIHHIINSDGSALFKFEAVLPARVSFRILNILNDAGLIPDGEGDSDGGAT